MKICYEFAPRDSRGADLGARVSQKDIKNLYHSLSGIYDVRGTLSESRASNRAIELAEIKDGQNILEVAVRTGLVFTRS